MSDEPVDGYLMMIACNGCPGISSCVAILPQASGRVNVSDLESVDKDKVNEYLNRHTACLNKEHPNVTKWHQVSPKELKGCYRKNIRWVNTLLEDISSIKPRVNFVPAKDRFSDLEFTE
jgi:hypothetical protein